MATFNLVATSVEVKADGSFERGGTFTFRENGDNFFSASELEPTYIRLRFNLRAKFAQTLVDIEANGGSAINLPLRLTKPRPGARLMAPPNTIQIARWRKGESELWLKINHSSSNLIEIDGVTGPPTRFNPVEFTIGFDGNSAHRYPGTARVEAGEANLPFPVRADNNQPAFTPIFLDLRNSILPEPPIIDSYAQNISFFPVPYDGITVGVETADSIAGIFLGPGVSMGFEGSELHCTIATFGGYSSTRWITHVTAIGAGFTSALIIDKPNLAYKTTLTAYRNDGSLIGVHEIDPFYSTEFLRIEPQELLDIFGQQPSHIQVDGHRAMRVSIEYGSDDDNTLLTHVQATAETDTFFTIYPTRSKNFTGLAAVNLGDGDARLELSWLEADGSESERVLLEEPTNLQPLMKRIWVLDGLVPADALAIRLHSDQPLSTTFLSGNLGQFPGPLALYQINPITSLK